MAQRERYDVLVILTNNAALIWKEARGIAPESVQLYANLKWSKLYEQEQQFDSIVIL